MGLAAATSIGVGTMVGAGIFVFPGIAGGYAGPAAMLSFLIGGLIAIVVAMCTAELSTAMPESGGGYYFISRSFGPFWGTLVGIAQWIGLVFACSFYLVGFGEYVLQLLRESGFQGDIQVVLFSGVATLLLLGVNIVGTEKVGYFQNFVVLVLTAILLLIFSYGIFDILGWVGETQLFSEFAPKGMKPVFTTTSLIFTSYLGFVQISTVAGEIIDPQKNLPRALIGSVLIVIFLYVFVIFVSSSVLSVEEMETFGEEATLEVGRRLLGDWGAIIILLAGLLATLSSANASMMSSSRSIYALSRDQLLPQEISKVNKKFGTPHITLLLVTVPVGAMLFRNSLELFAEVASFLHLIIYGGICLALFKLRRKMPIWYLPTYRVPFAKVLAIAGAVCCLGLIYFMKSASILVGSVIMAIAAVYYFLFQRDKKLSSPQPFHIDPAIRAPRILVPVDISDDENDIPLEIIKALQASRVLVLGYKLIPEQTEPEQSKEKYGEEAEKRLDQLCHGFEERSIDTKKEMVFTKNPVETTLRMIENENCNALLTSKPIRLLDRLLIPIQDISQVNARLSTLVQELSQSKNLKKLVITMTSDDNGAATEQTLKRLVNKRFGAVGLQIDNFLNADTEQNTPKAALKGIAKESDLVILAEAKDSNRKRILRTILKEKNTPVNSPIILVLRERQE